MRIDLDPRDRICLVQSIFSRIAPWYDPLNHIFSLGRDAFWRRAAARQIKLFRTGRILDLASGTGDQALALAEAHPGARIVGVDFNYPMLDRARAKIKSRDLGGSLSLVGGDALQLPFPDQCFDGVIMSFGLRNVPDREGAFKEMLRILVPGGMALVLELASPGDSLPLRLYKRYLVRLIPKIGDLISGQNLAYQYLADSIMDFPGPEEVADLMTRTGFASPGFLKLTFGVAVLHWGKRPE